MKNNILFLFLFCISLIFSQESDKKKITEIFNKSSQKYTNATICKISMTYDLFPTHKSKTSIESYNGVVIKKNDEQYSKIGATEFISLSTCQIKIDGENKLIQYNEQDKKENKKDIIGVNDYLKNFSKFELSNNEKEWICSLSTPSFSMIPYSKVVIYIKKTDYTVSKQILYLITNQKYKTKEGSIKEDYPRIEIKFNEFITKDIDFGNLFQLQNYLTINKSKVSPSNKYKGYKIVD